MGATKEQTHGQNAFTRQGAEAMFEMLQVRIKS